MKILILQLARFGDIYSTWLALHALKRQYPEAQIHLLVRSRFKHATTDLTSIDCVHTLETAQILEPCIESQEGFKESLEKVAEFVSSLQEQNFDKVINLSFSPFSSYLASLLKSEANLIVGYHRYSDGHLALTDNWSSYFYSQVGINKPNRIHLADLFAKLLNVELIEEDWHAYAQGQSPIGGAYCVVHLGASQKGKTYLKSNWLNVLTQISESWNGKIVLIGSADEASLSTEIAEQLSNRVLNLVGKTKISELFTIIKWAQLLIGADSAPIHIASLTNTVTLNLSCSSVNLWETGPRSPGSRILYSRMLKDLEPDIIAQEALGILNGERPQFAQYYVGSNREILALKEKRQPIENALVDFLYFGGSTPVSTDLNYASALVHMYDLAQLAIEQLYNLQRNPQDKIAQSVLQRTDEIMSTLHALVPELGVVVRWFTAEKIQIEPAGFISVLEKTFICYKRLNTVLTELQKHVNLTSYKGDKNGAPELERR